MNTPMLEYLHVQNKVTISKEVSVVKPFFSFLIEFVKNVFNMTRIFHGQYEAESLNHLNGFLNTMVKRILIVLSLELSIMFM